MLKSKTAAPSVEALYNVHPGEDVYVVGTGASMRVFPLDILSGKIVIGLNMAWRLLPDLTYAITMRPDLNVPEFIGESGHENLTWIIKYSKLTTDEQREYVQSQSQRFYNFRTDGQKNPLPSHEPSIAGRIPEWAEKPTGEFLYLWTSISQSAVNLAANMGAKNVILVGCDNGALGGNHHAHNQHTFWKGANPELRYHQYYEGLREVRTALRKRGVNLYSLTPFAGLMHNDEDFNFLCDETGQPRFIENEDISARFGYAPRLLSLDRLFVWTRKLRRR